MLKFQSEVRLQGTVTPADAYKRLTELIAPPRSFASAQRSKPLRGRLESGEGWVRWPLNQYRILSPRTLHFTVAGAIGGVVFKGSFQIWAPLRFVVLTWMSADLVVWAHRAIYDLIHHAGPQAVAKDLLPMLIGFAMGAGYLWFAVFLGRHRDRNLIAVIRNSLQTEAAAIVVKELLASDHVSFIDEP